MRKKEINIIDDSCNVSTLKCQIKKFSGSSSKSNFSCQRINEIYSCPLNGNGGSHSIKLHRNFSTMSNKGKFFGFLKNFWRENYFLGEFKFPAKSWKFSRMTRMKLGENLERILKYFIVFS